MTAVLAAAGRAVLGAVLVLACVAAGMFTALCSHGAWTVAWLAVVYVTVSGSVWAWERLGGERELLCGTCAEAAAGEGGGNDA